MAFRLSAQIYCGSSLLVCAVTHECAVTWEIPPRNVSCKQRWLTASGPIRTPLSGSEAPTGAAEPNVNTGAKCFACSYFMVEILPKWSSLFTWWSFIYEWGYSFIAKLANVTQGWVKVIFDFWKVIFFFFFWIIMILDRHLLRFLFFLHLETPPAIVRGQTRPFSLNDFFLHW